MKLSKEEIKAGWRIVRFGDVAREVKETTKDPLADGLEYYVGLEHLDPQSLRLSRKGVIAEDNPSFTRLFKPGQILFGKRRAYQKKAAVADFAGTCSGDIIVMEERPGKIIPGLLPFIVQSDMFFDFAVKTSSGSLSPRTKWKTLAEFEFPLPPLERQKAILEVLEKVDSVYPKFCEFKGSLERLFKKLLIETIWEQQASWKRMEVGTLGRIQMGRQRAPKYTTGEFTRKYLRVVNVLDGYLSLSDVEEMDFNERDFEQYRLIQNDILLTEGDIVSTYNIGRCALYEDELVDCCFQNTLIRFQAGNEIIPKFAYYLFRAAFYKGVFATASNMTTVAHLGSTRFSKIKLGVPCMEEQKSIVRILDEVWLMNTEIRERSQIKAHLSSKIITSVLMLE
ncbi:MAG: restriction endonuclease subunit S [Verrucomicrobiae bacterium]|nr:restriction endonuclease subunit S [Verrucomicrobiae bacterium]